MKNGKGWMDSIVHGALTVCNRSSYKDTPFAIHATGCSDIEKERTRNGAITIDRVGTLSSAIEYVLDEETREMGYDESHVRVFPCCKAAVSLEPRYAPKTEVA